MQANPSIKNMLTAKPAQICSLPYARLRILDKPVAASAWRYQGRLCLAAPSVCITAKDLLPVEGSDQILLADEMRLQIGMAISMFMRDGGEGGSPPVPAQAFERNQDRLGILSSDSEKLRILSSDAAGFDQSSHVRNECLFLILARFLCMILRISFRC